MAVSTGIDDFPEKLGLALGRARLSCQTAGEVSGIDGTLVATWLAGHAAPAMRPLAALSRALGERLPGFSRREWREPLALFAARLGYEPVPRTPRPPAAPILLPEDPAPLTAAEDDHAQAGRTYSGRWLLLHGSLQKPGQVAGLVCEIRDETGELRVHFEDRRCFQAQGSAMPSGARLLMSCVGSRCGGTRGVFAFRGTATGRAEIMEGIMLARAGDPAWEPGSSRVLALRLPDSVAFAAAGATVQRVNASGWLPLLPPLFAARVVDDLAEGRPRKRRSSTAGLTASDVELARRGAVAEGRRAALRAVQAMFAN